MVQWLAWKFRKLPLQAAICQLNLPEHKRKGPRQPLGLLAKMRQTPGGGPSAEGLRASAEPRQVSRAELSKAITRPGANSSPQRMREWDTFLGTREGEADRTGRKAEPTDLSLGSGSWWKPQGRGARPVPVSPGLSRLCGQQGLKVRRQHWCQRSLLAAAGTSAVAGKSRLKGRIPQAAARPGEPAAG